METPADTGGDLRIEQIAGSAGDPQAFTRRAKAELAEAIVAVWAIFLAAAAANSIQKLQAALRWTQRIVVGLAVSLRWTHDHG